MARLPREVVETLVAEAEVEIIDAIIHNEPYRRDQMKELRAWLLRSAATENDQSGEV